MMLPYLVALFLGLSLAAGLALLVDAIPCSRSQSFVLELFPTFRLQLRPVPPVVPQKTCFVPMAGKNAQLGR